MSRLTMRSKRHIAPIFCLFVVAALGPLCPAATSTLAKLTVSPANPKQLSNSILQFAPRSVNGTSPSW